MKPIGETKEGEVIYDLLWCDICGNVSGPRTRFDNCGSCGATREQRTNAAHITLIDMSLNYFKRDMEERAKKYKKRFKAEIMVKVEFSARKGDSMIHRYHDGSIVSKNIRDE